MKPSQYPIDFDAHRLDQLEIISAPVFSEVLSAVNQMAQGQLQFMLVYGYPGGGKSFVLQAAVKAMESVGKTGLFLSAESLISSSKALVEHSEVFDLVAIDDADQLLGTVHEPLLFHLINRCVGAQQLIFSMDQAPIYERILLQDLRSRLMQAAAFELPLLDSSKERESFLKHYLAVRSAALPSKLETLLVSEGPKGPAEFMRLVDDLQNHLAGRSTKRLPKAFFEELKAVVISRV